MRLPIRLRWVPLLATAVVVAIGISLGNWQTRRAEQKQGIEQAIAARAGLSPLYTEQLQQAHAAQEFRRVSVDGEFLADWPIYLENRPHGAQSGFHLLMPLRIADSEQVVLVLRGWFPRDPIDRSRVPAVPVPSGRQRIEGIVRQQPGRVMQLGEAPPLAPRAIVQNVDSDGFAAASGMRVQPFVIEQHNDTHDGLVRDWPAPSAGADKHRGYAFQWYALSAAALVYFIVTGIRSGSKRSEQA